MKHLGIIFIVVFSSFMVQSITLADESAEAAKTLHTGNYRLRLLTPDMPEKQRDISRPATITLDNNVLVVDMIGLMGNPVRMKGYCRNGKTKFGFTDIEDDNIISFHYLGKLLSDVVAEGTFVCFVNGKIYFNGKWVLSFVSSNNKKKTYDKGTTRGTDDG